MKIIATKDDTNILVKEEIANNPKIKEILVGCADLVAVESYPVQEGLNARNVISVSPELINSRWSLNQFQEDFIYVLTSQIEKDDRKFKTYIFNKSDLEKKMGIKINAKQLKENIIDLMSKVIYIDKGNGNFVLLSWISYFSYLDGIIKCRFDSDLLPYLLQLKQFIRSELKVLLKLESKYSKRIYLMLKEYAKFGKRHFNIEELQEQLEVPKSLKNYADFKRKVLIQSIKEINAKTDLEIKNLSDDPDKQKWFEEKKLGRKVVEVIVHFKKNSADFEAFIENIRTLHVNVDLYKINNRILRCSSTGLLYYADNPNEYINKKDALKYWNMMFENRDKLMFIEKELEEIKQKLLEQYKLTT